MTYLNIFCIFLSLLIKAYSRSKKMFQLLTYIIPLDAIQYHRHTQIMKAWLHNTLINRELKTCVCYFSFFHQMTALKQLWKMLFISSEKLYSFSRYSNFYFSIFPSFFPVSHWLRGWSKRNLKIYNVSNCLNKNLITHFVWYLEKEKIYGIELCHLMEY